MSQGYYAPTEGDRQFVRAVRRYLASLEKRTRPAVVTPPAAPPRASDALAQVFSPSCAPAERVLPSSPAV